MRLAVGLLSALLVLTQAGPSEAAGLADRAIAGVVKAGCDSNRPQPPPSDTLVGQAHDRVMKYALQREMQRQLGEERQKQLLGDESGAGMAGIVDLLDCANRLFLERALEVSRRDCDYAREEGMPLVLGMERQNQLLGNSSGVDVMGGTVDALDNCWKEATKDCIEPGDNERMAYTIGLARQGQLLGAGEDAYNLDAISICSTTSLPTAASRRIADVAQTVGNWFGIGGGT